MTREGDGRDRWVPNSRAPESRHAVVSSVVNVPKEAKSMTDNPEYRAKMDEIFKIYGDVFSAKPC